VGLILDLAVVALALVVIGSLALLAWTLAVSAVRASSRERQRIAGLRTRVTDAEARLVAATAPAAASLAELADRSAAARPAHANRDETPGDPPDA
jgi:hypothetical protein